MALKSLALTKAKNITSEVADHYQQMSDTMQKLGGDTAGRIANLSAIIVWDGANPGMLDSGVVTEAQQLLDYMKALGGLLASAPPVPNM
ncbi:MAG: hypothetical protein COB49_00405 [Alphaproteobacteria bacterium]|nr:MAG: hypothetical protein COB49_00405 [Alphaproteobacteria bacterium]